jgi:hypothetical protein
MSWLKRLFSRHPPVARDHSEEIQDHLDERIEALVAEGASSKEANAAARRQFGNMKLIEDENGDVWRWRFLEDWNRDAERRIRESGISYTILRANYFMQNLFGNAEQIRQGAFTNGPAAKRIALIDAGHRSRRCRCTHRGRACWKDLRPQWSGTA